MLLRALYNLSASRNLLADPAFLAREIRYVIALDASGGLLGAGPLVVGDAGHGKAYPCPATTRKKTAGGVAEFLVDGLTAVFGLDTDPDGETDAKKRARREANNRKKTEDFWKQMENARSSTGSASLGAVFAFHCAHPDPPSFLRWGAKQDGDAKRAWWITGASGDEGRLEVGGLFTFSVDGKLVLEDHSIREFWRQQHGGETAATEAEARRGLCLITGDTRALLARTHDPAVRGVRGAQMSGAKLVSFETSAPAFSSHGWRKALNAPTGISAARAYATALQWLLDQPDHHLHIGSSTTCFWARESAAAEGLFACLLHGPDPQAVARFLKAPWSGLERPPLADDDFYVVGLAGSGGRIAVRRWLQLPLEEAAAHLRLWFADLDLAGPAPGPNEPPPLGIARLARCAAPLKKIDGRLRPDEDAIPPDLPSQLYAAAVGGAAPPLALVARLLAQFRSRLLRDDGFSPARDRSRFSLLRLTLNRNRGSQMEIPAALAADTSDPAYNCGRLLAVLQAAQAKAHDFRLEGPGIAERYFGSASVSPAAVFPLLLRLNRHHLRKIAGSQRYASHARFLEEQVREIASRFRPAAAGAAPNFPRHLDLHAQGRFALGFYQQAADDAARRDGARSARAGGPGLADPDTDPQD